MTTTLDFDDTPSIDTQDPTREGLKTVLEGRPLVRESNLVRYEHCQRCDRDPPFDDGERVTLICGYDADPVETRGWVVTAVWHADHPTRDKDDVAAPDRALADVTARLDRDGWTYTHTPLDGEGEPYENHVEDRSVVRDVDIEWFSEIGDGQERELIVEPEPAGPLPYSVLGED